MPKKYKYPRTPHLPWSEGCTNDDKKLNSTDHFKGKMVVVTEKMDGENTNIGKDYYHARSLDGNHHNSQSYVKNIASKIQHMLLPEERVCGENLFAKHSIYYDNLEDYFLYFSIWNNDYCKPWDITLGMCSCMGLNSVPVIYRGRYDEKLIKAIKIKDNMEGYVVRLEDGFGYNEFDKSVAKFVRRDHVQTDSHWKSQQIVKNKLKE